MADQISAADLTVLHRSQCDTAYLSSNLPLIPLQQVVQQRRTFPRCPPDSAVQHAYRTMSSCAVLSKVWAAVPPLCATYMASTAQIPGSTMQGPVWSCRTCPGDPHGSAALQGLLLLLQRSSSLLSCSLCKIVWLRRGTCRHCNPVLNAAGHVSFGLHSQPSSSGHLCSRLTRQ